MRMGGASNKGISNVIKGNLESYRACKKNGVPVSPFFIIIPTLFGSEKMLFPPKADPPPAEKPP